jgi:hypothetical protein
MRILIYFFRLSDTHNHDFSMVYVNCGTGGKTARPTGGILGQMEGGNMS